jgi:hypothetical protein
MEGQEGTAGVEGALEDVFANSFDQAEGEVKVDAKPDIEKIDAPPNDSTIDKKEEKTIENPPVVDEEKTWEQRYKSLQGVHKHDKEVWETERTTLIKKAEKVLAPQIPAAAAPIENQLKTEEKKIDALQSIYDLLTPEQKDALKEYDEEFDVVSKMEGLKREAALKELRKEIETFKAEVMSQLAPAQTMLQETKVEREERAKEEHFGAIAKAHSDYETFRDDGSILKWIETKPKYAQKAMIETYKAGTTEDIIDLLTDFKKENNIGPPPDNPVVDINIKREQKRQALTAVTTKRGAVNAVMPANNDFESSFEEALRK